MATTKATREVATAPLKIIDGGKSEKLTGKQLAYVQAILKGANQSDAYREAYNAENMSAQGQCQRKANRSAQLHYWQFSGSKLTPLCKGDGAIEFEVFASVEVTFLIEVIVN